MLGVNVQTGEEVAVKLVCYINIFSQASLITLLNVNPGIMLGLKCLKIESTLICTA